MTKKTWILLPTVAVFGAVGISCASAKNAAPGWGDGGVAGGDDGSVPVPVPTDDGGPISFVPGDTAGPLTRTCDPCTDFPADPVLDPKPDDGSAPPPANSVSLFAGAPGGSGGPCILEPQDGALIPQNWLRPRFRFTPTTGNLFQIRLHTKRQTNDYVVITTSKTWKMPKDVWDKLRATTWDEPITATISAVNSASPGTPVSSTATFTIAPVGAGGSMIYWAAVGENDGQSWLEGFGVGDEGVISALQVSQVASTVNRDQGGQLQNGGKAACIGCHTAIPDGKSVAFVDFWPWSGDVASVDPASTGAAPPWLTPGGAEAFSQPWIGITAFSKGDWKSEKVAVTSYATMGMPWSGQTQSDQPKAELAWIDLATQVPAIGGTSGWALGMGMMSNFGKSYGFLARTGDPNGAESPTWSHDGGTVTYVSTNAGKDGRLNMGVADLYSVPFNARKGGTASPIAGASDPAFSEYYPAYSPDDKLIAFNHAPASEVMYYNPDSEIYVVPAAGGKATRLAANDPPACAGAKSPGILNSWPKWSPQAQAANGKTYYWIIFSSARDGATFKSTNLKMGGTVKTSQLYITGVAVDSSGAVTSYPAIYLWNQPTQAASKGGDPQSNHTPAWDIVSIPPVPPPR